MANKVMKITAADFEKVVRNVVNQRMQIAQHASPYIPQERPREGVGGTNEHPFDDFGNDRNPPVINPATGKPEWAGTNQGMTIAGGPSFDIGPGHGAAKKKAKGFNKTRNNPNDREVEMIKKWLGGPELPDVSGQPEFDQFMHNMRRGGQNPKSGSIKHHPPHIQKLILGIGNRIRA